MKRVVLLFVVLLGAVSTRLRADIPPPPPPEAEKSVAPNSATSPESAKRQQQSQRSMFPMLPHSGWHERAEMFKQLSEPDRKRVREAFEKVWNRADVAAARDKLTKANEEYRQIIQHALQEADPEVPKILEKARPPLNGGGFAMGRMPDPNDPEFANKALSRLAAELQSATHQDHREGMLGHINERVLQTPEVAEAVNKLREAHTAPEKLDAWRHLRETYATTARQLITALREGKEGEQKPK